MIHRSRFHGSDGVHDEFAADVPGKLQHDTVRIGGYGNALSQTCRQQCGIDLAEGLIDPCSEACVDDRQSVAHLHRHHLICGEYVSFLFVDEFLGTPLGILIAGIIVEVLQSAQFSRCSFNFSSS